MAAKAKAGAARKPAKKNGYELPKPLKSGEVLIDTAKRQWKIGESIGIGGFGEIYSACDASSGIKKLDDYPCVVKLEPHANGPLFVERNFYMRNAKKEDVEKFRAERKLKHLGMPIFMGSGSHEIQKLNHRFLVMPRYGSDIWKIFLEENRKFPLHTVYRLGWQLISVLEYIHHCGYVHMDIKGTNVLLGFGKGGDEHVYLLDYGLASRFKTEEFKKDPKKAHNGTIEYTSRDAHDGVTTIRGDIEILAYNLVEWAGGKLPWTASSSVLQKPQEVQKMKEEFMKSTDKSLKAAYGSTSVPSQIAAFCKYVETMKFDTTPDYQNIRKMFETGLKELKQTNAGKLIFSDAGPSNAKERKAAKSPTKRVHPQSSESPVEKQATKKPKVTAAADDDDEPVQRTRRARNPVKYAEQNDADTEEEVTVQKSVKAKVTSPKKSAKSPKKTDKSPRKSDKSPKAKGSPKASTESQVFLKSKTEKSKKRVELTFDLNISLDTDVVVTVNRKDKKKDPQNGDEQKSESRAGYYKGKYAK